MLNYSVNFNKYISIFSHSFQDLRVEVFVFEVVKTDIQLFRNFMNVRVSFQQFHEGPYTIRYVYLAEIIQIRVTFASQAKVVLVTMFVIRVSCLEMDRVGVNFDELDIFNLHLQVSNELSDFGFDITLPSNEFLKFLPHNRQLYVVGVSVKKVYGTKQFPPLFFVSAVIFFIFFRFFVGTIDTLDQFRSLSQKLPCDMTSNFRYIMGCIHMGVQRGIYLHSSFYLFLQITHLYLYRHCPYPVSINEKEPIQQLQWRVVRVQLTYFCQHNGQSCTTQITVNLRINPLIFSPHFYGFQHNLVVFIVLHIFLQIQTGSITVYTSQFFIFNLSSLIDLSLKEMRIFHQETHRNTGNEQVNLNIENTEFYQGHQCVGFNQSTLTNRKHILNVLIFLQLFCQYGEEVSISVKKFRHDTYHVYVCIKTVGFKTITTKYLQTISQFNHLFKCKSLLFFISECLLCSVYNCPVILPTYLSQKTALIHLKTIYQIMEIAFYLIQRVWLFQLQVSSIYSRNQMSVLQFYFFPLRLIIEWGVSSLCRYQSGERLYDSLLDRFIQATLIYNLNLLILYIILPFYLLKQHNLSKNSSQKSLPGFSISQHASSYMTKEGI